jgi:hypothetical protein
MSAKSTDLHSAARDVIVALRRVAEPLDGPRYSITERKRLQQTLRTVADALEACLLLRSSAPPTSVKNGAHLCVQTQGESWRLTFYGDEANSDLDAVCLDIERDGHNFAPTLTAKEAGAVIDALLVLLPAAREHSKLVGSAT